jgi:CHAT domain-containing protein
LKKPKLLAYCLSVFSLIGGAPQSRSIEGPAARRPSSALSRRAAELRVFMKRGAELYRHGFYQGASQVYQSVFAQAKSESFPKEAARALGNLGGCQFALHQYKTALRSFLEARRLAESAGDEAFVAVSDANIASLYLETGEVDSAAEWTSRSLQRITGFDRTRQLPKLQIEMAILRALQGRMPEAMALFRDGIQGADRAGDVALYALGWHRLGGALLQRGDLAAAEPALLEAYRIRKLHHLPLDMSYRSLGRLRLAQGDLASASALLDRAVESVSQPNGLAPTWDIYHWRGLVRMAQGRLPDALSDLRIALRLGRAWRWSEPAKESVQLGAESWLDQVHSALVEAGNRLYLQTHDPALLRETFTANEENRAVSLRALWNSPKRGNEFSTESTLPGAYWQALARLQRAEVAALQGNHTADLAGARAELVRMETSLGDDFRPLPDNLAETTQRQLDPVTALFSFHLGASISWVWALDREGMEVYALPGRATIQTEVGAVTAAIRDNHADAAALSASLYQTIFGPIAPRFRKAQHWLLALDGSLFGLPVSALVETFEPAALGTPVYIAERHTVELIPGVAYWLESSERSDPQLSSLFIGVGDPVYNRADAREPHIPSGPAPSLVLPRLVGSGAEIDACARAWHGRSVLLRGPDASREKLAGLLRERPAAVHLATHYVESAGKVRYSLIALSLSPRGETEILSPIEISGWQIHAGLVVLSGCHSAAGAALPGEGVMGLTRAWLAAGAHSVIGSLWDTPDDEGALFGELYRDLRALGRLDAAQALHEAQLKMIERGGRFARPSYWGTYFAVANRGIALIPPDSRGGES